MKYALQLAGAFGTSEELWINLQNAYDLAIAAPKDISVTRRAKLYDKAPIREMQKRQWIGETKDIDLLETQLCQFFDINSIDDEVDLAHAARKSDDYRKISPSQAAWLMRAKNLAPSVSVTVKYTKRLFDTLMNELAILKEEPEEIQQIPRVLAEHGIRFLIVEAIPRSKIDGACFWLDQHSPVVVLSLRHNRIDNFWQSLCHELKHIREGHGIKEPILETAMVGSDAQPFDEKPAEEQAADQFAAEFLVKQRELQDFINRTDPYFSKNKVLGFALRMKVHPGIVVGQLQYKGAIKYSYFRSFLVAIQDTVMKSTLTDGWGRTA